MIHLSFCASLRTSKRCPSSVVVCLSVSLSERSRNVFAAKQCNGVDILDRSIGCVWAVLRAVFERPNERPANFAGHYPSKFALLSVALGRLIEVKRAVEERSNAKLFPNFLLKRGFALGAAPLIMAVMSSGRFERSAANNSDSNVGLWLAPTNKRREEPTSREEKAVDVCVLCGRGLPVLEQSEGERALKRSSHSHEHLLSCSLS